MSQSGQAPQGDLQPPRSWRELEPVGVVIVDHGSRRPESNRLLLEVADMFGRLTRFAIVEPAHMELAEPTIETAFGECVKRGARLVVVYPYFLLPGSHWDRDIPALAAKAARRHPGVPFLVTAPLGLHPLMAEIMSERIEHCLAHSRGDAPDCDACRGADKCRVRRLEDE